MRHCKKCGKEGHHPEIVLLRMAGGYHTELCISCQNLAAELLQPELKHIAGLDACLAAAVHGGDLETATDYAERVNVEKVRLYAMSKSWVTGE